MVNRNGKAHRLGGRRCTSPSEKTLGDETEKFTVSRHGNGRGELEGPSPAEKGRKVVTVETPTPYHGDGPPRDEGLGKNKKDLSVGAKKIR